MEGCGLILAAPVTFVTSLLFCLLAHFAFCRWPQVRRICVVAAFLIVAALVIEAVLSLHVGPFHLHGRFGRGYWTFHMVGFLLGPPATAVLVYVAVSRFVSLVFVRVGLATVVCWLTCMTTLLANILVDEDIQGVDGSGQRPSESLFPP
jgi:hypothetical protein